MLDLTHVWDALGTLDRFSALPDDEIIEALNAQVKQEYGLPQDAEPETFRFWRVCVLYEIISDLHEVLDCFEAMWKNEQNPR